ncbi:MAG: TetR/AcrR family transcriptional regulator, partial [Tissierellia bacterium]|nr:TetR/AcrR family transcriptional regulator [Tissierellia bacterium]
MVKFKRLSPEERKRQICIAAKEVFLEKGFHNTTMEDVIAASKMSKGGVYNYYKSTTDMLYDLMLMGMNLRLSVSDDFIHKFQDLSLEDQFVELLF